MLTDVKTWLETTGLKVAEERFLRPPALPYIVFTESRKIYGADNKNKIASRNISIELYSEKIDTASENCVESLLNGIDYNKDRIWIQSDLFFQTIYDFELVEKI
jgi:hypothetical protein